MCNVHVMDGEKQLVLSCLFYLFCLFRFISSKSFTMNNRKKTMTVLLHPLRFQSSRFLPTFSSFEILLFQGFKLLVLLTTNKYIQASMHVWHVSANACTFTLLFDFCFTILVELAISDGYNSSLWRPQSCQGIWSL